MFWRKSKDALWEDRITDLKKEHQRTVEALTAWIEQLQLQVGAAGSPPPQAVHRPAASGSAAPPEMAMFMGEEEEALRDAHANDLIDDNQLNEGLKQIGFLNTEVTGT
jgi:hypothetical protein